MTVKEIAEVCNVSEQTIRNYCNKNQIPKTKSARGKQTFFIDFDLEKAIIEEFKDNKNKNQNQNDSTIIKNQSKNQSEIGLLKQQIEDLHKTIETLTAQLTEKDLQLAEKDKQIQALIETTKDLTNAVQQAHTLHYNQQQQITMADSEAELTEQAQTEQTEKKKGFFSRFKKSK